MLQKQYAYIDHSVFVAVIDEGKLTPGEGFDIVPRIRLGFEELKKYNVDVIAIMENDDWYSQQYLNYIVSQWEKHNRPDLFGTSYTIYYHLKFKAWYRFEHSQRASLMNTLIKPDAKFEWPVDNEPFLDIHLWANIRNRMIFVPDKHYSMGIKHGVGLCGGGMHEDDKMNRLRFPYPDPDGSFLKEHLDHTSFNFYFNYFNGTQDS